MRSPSADMLARTAAAFAALALSPALVVSLSAHLGAADRAVINPREAGPVPAPPARMREQPPAPAPQVARVETPGPSVPPMRRAKDADRAASVMNDATPASVAWGGHEAKALPRSPRAEGTSDHLPSLRPIPRPECSRRTYGSAVTVALDAPRSGFLSTAWVGDREGPETSVVVLTIPEGTQRFHMVVTEPTTPLIYDVRGDTGAVMDVAVLSRPGRVTGRVGIAGLPPSRIAFVESDACPDPVAVHRDAGAALVAGLTRSYDLDRADVLTPEASTTLPSGLAGPDPARMASEGRFADGMLAASARAAFPNGIVDVDPGAIVSTAPTGRHVILPREAGLAEGFAFGITPEPGAPDTFMVSTRTALPPGMCGTHAVRLDVRDGVPTPTGDPCDSCFVRRGAPVPRICQPAR